MTREELLAKWIGTTAEANETETYIEQPEINRVLDQGHVRLIDVMGDDSAIVQAARVSYGKGTKSVSDDRNLIRYLMSHRHTTPMEMCVIKLHIRMPMDAHRQHVRHRMASINEYSTRYSEAIDARQETLPHEWRLQSNDNKQGSDGFLDVSAGPDEFSGAKLSAREAQLHRLTTEIYQERLTAGVAREQARKDLPLSTYTEYYWKTDLHNLFHYLSLRMDSHAQLEIRSYANKISEIVKDWVPLAWEAFEDYRINATQFSAMELAMLKNMLDEHMAHEMKVDPETRKALFQTYSPKMSIRERKAFLIKLGILDSE